MCAEIISQAKISLCAVNYWLSLCDIFMEFAIFVPCRVLLLLLLSWPATHMNEYYYLILSAFSMNIGLPRCFLYNNPACQIQKEKAG
jgi:hypothetical protein